MPYHVVKIYPNGEIEENIQPKAPVYKELRDFVSGLIQTVPHLNNLSVLTTNLKRGQMIVNEEGILLNMPFNTVATKIWLENLGKGSFSYEPKLYGNAIYWAKVKT